MAADDKLSAAAQAQIDALQAEKENRTPAQQKMDSQLIFKVKKQRGEKLGATLKTMEDRIVVAADGTELVEIQGEVTDALLAEVKRVGGQVVSSLPQFKSLLARVPLTALEGLAARPEVRFIRPPVKSKTHVGASTSQGDTTHRANLARQMLNATGKGIKIGVISDSVDSLSASQASGDLGPVTVLPGQAGLGATGEGTAMLEIVHDLAPDAELYFASANASEAQFAQNILDLRAAGCDIIVDDVGYFDESPFQDGPVAQAVDQVVASGALYFSAAGNEGSVVKGTSGTWEGDFADGGATSPTITKAGRLHTFGTQTYDTVTLASGIASLFWTDPLGASRNDYDLYLFDSTGTTLLTASTNSQTGSQDPYEIMQTTDNTRIVVVKSPGAQPRHLHLNTLGGTIETSTTGTIQGHPAAAGAIAVAAVDATASFPNAFTNSSTVEDFSTEGNRRFFFYADGTPTTPGNLLKSGGFIRNKPDMAAADGVTTSVPGFAPFYGTSAAAPHAAAIAALVWSRNRSLTPQQVRGALAGTALDIESAGFDRVSGVGLLDALAATQAVAGGPIVQAGTVSITAESFTPANSVIDPGETITVAVPLNNIGGGSTTNLTARLLATGGVSNPSTPAAYGAVSPASNATRNFSFQANGSVGGTIALTFVVNDGAAYLGTFSATFAVGSLGAAQTFNNAAAISIPSSGPATPYPSAINVSGFPGGIGKVTVTLNGFGHTYPSDVDVLLVSPTGKKVIILSDAGANHSVSGVNLTFDDGAPAMVGSTLATGTYKPSPVGGGSLTTSLDSPAPAAPYAGTLSAFNGDNPNGAWQLWIRDQISGDSGSVASGWTLRIQPVGAGSNNGPNSDVSPVLQQSKSLVSVGEAVVYTAVIYNDGPVAASNVVLTDALPAVLSFGNAQTTVGTVTNANNTVTANIGTLASGQSATVTITAVGASAGAATNTVSVAVSGTENTTANNTASASITVGLPNLAPFQPANWSGQVVVSTVAGTTTDAATINPTDLVFLDYAFTNTGAIPAHSYFDSQLYVDGILRRTFTKQLALAPGEIAQQLDLPLGSFASGIHTVQLKVDALGDVAESDETDNVFTRTFLVQGANQGSNLTTVTPADWSDKIVVSKTTGTNTDDTGLTATDALFLDRAIINNSAVAVTTPFTTTLYVDSVLRTTWMTPSLAAGASDLVQDFALGTLAAGAHTLRIVIDAGGTVGETDETDNEYVKVIVVGSLVTTSSIGNQTIVEDGTTGALAFTVSGATGAISVSGASSNPSVVPTDNIMLGGTGTSRTVQVKPAPNQNGSAGITLTVSDSNGGQATLSFTVQVNAVNDAPSFTAGPAVDAAQDAGGQIIDRWATNISPGPANESAQLVNFIVVADQPALFAVQPAISPTGTLTFTPMSGASGKAIVTVTLHDNGGTGSGNSDTSAAQMFAINVTTFAEETGTYNGLAQPAAAGLLENARAGLVKVTISKTGRFTGKVMMAGKPAVLSGSFDNGGVARFGKTVAPTLTIKRTGQPDLLLTLSLDVAGGTNKLAGLLTMAGAPFANISADRALFTAKKNPVAPLQNVPASLVGSYTVVFAAKTPVAQGRPAAEFPQGDGIGTLTVAASGTVTLRGTLADGTAVSYSNALSPTMTWPFYVSLARGKGSISGPATFRLLTGSAIDGLNLLWFKPAGPAPYAAGWPGGITTDFLGSRYAPATGATGFQATDADGNAQVTLTDGGLTAPGVLKGVNLSLLAKVPVVQPAADKLALTFKKSNGTLIGSFIPPGATKSVKLYGVVFPAQSAAFGFFNTAAGSGSLSIAPADHPMNTP